jgi:hypothetical protein
LPIDFHDKNDRDSYAPELHLVGVAAAAPATDLTMLMTDDLDTTGGRAAIS